MSTLLSVIGALVALFLCLPLIAFALWSLLWYVANRIRVDALDDVYDKLMALEDVPLAVKQQAWANMQQAIDADKQTWVYDWSAPLVCAVALIGRPESATKLPHWARKWDNNVSINGDGWAVFRDGEWLTLRDGIEAQPGERAYSYDDLDYKGRAYYAKSLKPRSYLARWLWLTRNRASQLSVDLGVAIRQRPWGISGRSDIDRGSGVTGHFLLTDGVNYQFKSIQKTTLAGVKVAEIRSVGYKLELAKMRPDHNLGRAAAVAIGVSYKKWKGG